MNHYDLCTISRRLSQFLKPHVSSQWYSASSKSIFSTLPLKPGTGREATLQEIEPLVIA
jgi:hypothetical protein